MTTRGPTITILMAAIAIGTLLTLNRCSGEIFTNPFLLREALLTEGELVKMITGFGIDRSTALGKAIEEFSEEHGLVAQLLSKPLEEYPPSANEDELLHDIASNPIHAFKLIYRLRKGFMGKVLPMIRTKWPKGKTNIFNRSTVWQLAASTVIVILQIRM